MHRLKITHGARPLAPVAIALLLASPPTANAQVASMPPSATVAPLLPADSLRVHLDDYLSRAAGFGFSGAVLVSRDGAVVLSKGYGLSDREHGVPFSVATPFDVGSVAKTYTAAAILSLRDAGKLALTDSLGRFLPDAPADKRRITLQQLLTHTAGFARDVSGFWGVRSAGAAKDTILSAPLRREPGAQFEYSNAGFILLRFVIERASGVPYERYLRDHLFLPAGLKQTGYDLPQWNRRLVARGYDAPGYRGSPLDLPMTFDPSHPDALENPRMTSLGAGGLLSTVSDLWRWSEALRLGRVLSAESRHDLFTPVVTIPRGETHFPGQYALAWFVRQTPRGTRLIGHDGGFYGFSDDVAQYIDEHTTVIFASNAFGEVARIVHAEVASIVFGGAPPVLPAGDPTPGRAAQREVIGEYETALGGSFRIENESGRTILLSADARAATQLVGLGDSLTQQRVHAALPRYGRLIDDLVHGRPDSLLSLLPSTADLATERTLWKETVGRWVAADGQPTEVRYVGARTRGPSTDLYYVLAADRGARLVRLELTADGRGQLNPFPPDVFPLRVPLVRSAPGQWTGYNVLLRRPVVLDRDAADPSLLHIRSTGTTARRQAREARQ